MDLISFILEFICTEAAITLDSFAGSGTTGPAVLALNKGDDGKGQYILVLCEEYADRIAAERIRRNIKGIPNSKGDSLRKGLAGSFIFCTLDEPVDV